jgi:hypothetical protein
MSYGAYRKHLAAAEAYDARARAHRARAERHRSLAFGGPEEDAAKDAQWRLNPRDLQLSDRDASTLNEEEQTHILQEYAREYGGKPWDQLPAYVQEMVVYNWRPPKGRRDADDRYWDLIDEGKERHARQEAAKRLVGGVPQPYRWHNNAISWPGDPGYSENYERCDPPPSNMEYRTTKEGILTLVRTGRPCSCGNASSDHRPCS